MEQATVVVVDEYAGRDVRQYSTLRQYNALHGIL
jgi:hypothetical protein